MLTKSLLFAFLAACGVTAVASPDDPPDGEPPGPPVEDGQYFCCTSIDIKTKSGNGCTIISEAYIAACDKVLHCNDWAKEGDKVTCL